MTVDYHNIISIVQIICFVPVLFAGILLCMRHGFARSSGWFYLIIFSIIRILGAAFQLATIQQPTTIWLYVASAILAAIGLSPLLLVLLGLLSRMYSPAKVDRAANNTEHTEVNPTNVSPRIMRFLQLIILAVLILGIVGGNESGNDLSSTGVYTVQTVSKVASILYIILFIALAGLTGLLVMHIRVLDRDNRRVVICCVATLPFILVRLIFSVLGSFDSHPGSPFYLLSPNMTVFLCMAVLEEIIVMFMYAVLGFSIRSAKEQRRVAEAGSHELQNAPYK